MAVDPFDQEDLTLPESPKQENVEGILKLISTEGSLDTLKNLDSNESKVFSKMLRGGNEQIFKVIQTAKDSNIPLDQIQDFTRNRIQVEVANTPKGDERKQVQSQIKKLEPEFDKLLADPEEKSVASGFIDPIDRQDLGAREVESPVAPEDTALGPQVDKLKEDQPTEIPLPENYYVGHPADLAGLGAVDPVEETTSISTIGKIFDILQRGQYASANVAKALMEEDGEVAIAAWKGLTGEEKGSFIDIYKQHNVPYANAIGLMLDITLDPINALPFGFLRKPFTALGKTKGAKALKESVPTEKLGELFIPGYGLPAEYYESKLMAKYALQAEELQVLDDLGRLSQGLSKSDRELLSRIRQGPDRIEELNAFQYTKLEDFANEFERLGLEAVDEKIITKETFEKWRDTYLPGFFPGKSKVSKGDIPPKDAGKVKKPFFAKQKKFSSLEEAENYALTYGRPDLMPETDISKLYGLRAIEQTRFLAKKKFVDSTLANFGQRVTMKELAETGIPEGMGVFYPKGALRFYEAKTIDEQKLVDLLLNSTSDEVLELTDDLIGTTTAVTKNVPAYLLPKEIAEDLNKGQKLFVNNEETNWLLRNLYDKPHNAWKAMATSVRLPFHLRNWQSNTFLMWLGGVKPQSMPGLMKDAVKVQKRSKGTMKIGDEILTYEQVNDLATKFGIRGRGWVGGDFETRILDDVESVISDNSALIKFAKHPFKSMATTGRKVGIAIEDNARVSLFVDALRKGEAPEEAARRVKKYLFDYQELTPFEQNVGKRIFPFYTWMRKNIPLQISSILNQPAKYAKVGKTYDAINKKWDQTIQEKMSKPDYFRDMMYVKTSLKSKTGEPVFMSIDLPFKDVNTMFKLNNIISSMSPFKVIPELILNVKNFPRVGQKIEKVEGFTRVPAPFYMAWFPEKIRKHIGMGPMLDPISGEQIMGVRAKWKYAVETMFPFMSEMGKMNPQPIRLEEERKPWRILSYLTGVKFTPLNIEQANIYKAFDQQRRLDEIASVMRNRGEALSTEELEILLERKKK